ncbi:unnamed protein product [Orchesella dallaii]|uniref:Uncharacterized protein n=1 Tax=Orchesella dallaii TaxID=48710 RepID=A0ABP1PN10_9HEXA
MAVRQRQASGSNGRITDTLGIGQREGLELNDDDYEDFYALLKDARSINSGSYITSMIWEIAQFFLDEGNPFIFLILIMNVFGGDSWYRVFIPLAINVVTSSIIAYYLTVEKHDVSRLKQGSRMNDVFVDSSKKLMSLINHFCIERTRRKKRSQKLEVIEKAMYKDRNNEKHWITTEGFLELIKFYSSQLRYQKEELLIATLRSSVLAMYNVYALSDRVHFALPMCRLNDVFKVLYILWIVFKVSAATYNFDKRKLRYVAVSQLWASLRLRAGADCEGIQSCLDDTRCFSSVAEIEDSITHKSLNWTMYIMSTFSRFVAATLIIITAGIQGLVMWILIMVTLNYTLLTRRCSEESVRSVFDNPPTGFTTRRNQFITRVLSTFLFYNHGYTRKYKIPRRTCLTIAFSVGFYLIILFVKGAHFFNSTELFSLSHFFFDDGGNFAKRFRCSSIFGNSSWTDTFERLKCMRELLKTHPVDALEYIGGLRSSSIFLILFPIVTFMSELLCDHDRIMEKFDKFPFLDAADCVRSLINAVVTTNEERLNVSGVNFCYVRGRDLFVLLTANSKEFENLCARLSQCVCFPFYLENETELTERIDKEYLEVANRIVTTNFTIGQRNLSNEKLIEMGKLEMSRLGQHHPLWWDVSQLFRSIEGLLKHNRVNSDEVFLFIRFCRILNQRLCEMSSSRIERIFQILEVDIVKTYES